MQAKKLLQSVKNILAYHQQLGIDGYSRDVCFDDFLSRTPGSAVSESYSNKSRTIQSGVEPIRQQLPAKVVADSTAAHQALNDEITACSKCGLADSKLFPVIGRGGTGAVRLLIVGDWFRAGNNSEQSGVMGVEEDVMVHRMMEAIGLNGDQYHVTNVIKCAIMKDAQPKAKHVETCLPYLLRQIQIYTPEVICTMGLIGTRALLQHKAPLASIRGRFHSFITEDGGQLPVFPIYHPHILAQHIEMKKVAWKDLQFLAKFLRLQPRR